MRIAILGYGVEGQSVERYFAKRTAQELADLQGGMSDGGEVGAEIRVLDEAKGDDFDDPELRNYDMVFRSPAVAPSKITADARVTSVTRYFFEHCPCEIVGVTGTKGKGTTSALITEICQAAGRKVWLVGNIGVPALDVLDELRAEDVVVYELSSFQLWDLERSPHVAVIARMGVDHLNVHADVADYVGAKRNIVRWQNAEDWVVYGGDDAGAVELVRGAASARLEYPVFDYDEVLAELQIPGEHNRRNAMAAILAARCLGVVDSAVLRRGIGGFTGLPHRLKLVREVSGVRYYDDSYSTMPASAIAAVRAFAEPKILILGGSDKGADFGELAEVVASGGVKLAILVGPEREKIGASLSTVGFSDVTMVDAVPYDMREVLRRARDAAKAGDVVILSPACASFDSFANYSERGEKFIEAVNDL